MKQLISNKVIVVCSQNFNGYGMLRSLADAGIKPIMVVNRCKNPIISLTRLKDSISYYESINQIPGLLIDKYSNFPEPPVVICCDDAIQSVVDDNYNILKKYFILSNINDKEGEISRIMNKDIQMQIALEAGLTVPKFWIFRKGDQIGDDVLYPCFAKTPNSIKGSKSDMRICRNREELQNAVKNTDYIVQEYIKKDYEVIIWGTSIGDNKYYMTGVSHKVRHLPIETGMTSFGIVESFEEHPNLDINAVIRFLNSLNYIGMFSIEFAVKNGTYYFLEINLRNDGLQHISTVAGANLPLMYIKSRLNISNQENINVKYPTYYMGELTDYQHINKSYGVTLKSWMKDLKRTDSFFIINWRDLLPSLSEICNKIWNTIRYRLGIVK